MELGVFSLTDMTGATTPSARVAEVVDLGVQADKVGLDVFGVGEHHTSRFAVSSPAVVLAAVAARTASVRLTSTVSVLSVLDPVRLHQDFAELDLVSGGRAEVAVGRSAYAEPFALFGVALGDYEAAFEEKLHLMLALRGGAPVTWAGRFRAPLTEAYVVPQLERPFPVWVGVGGTPASAVRAGRLGLPMSLALLGGSPARARPLVDAYRHAAAAAGHASAARVAGVSHLYVGTTSQEARETFYPYYRTYFAEGRRTHLDRTTFELMAGPDGPLVIGSAGEVADKIALRREALGIDRFLGQADLGGLPPRLALASAERLGRDVAPQLRS